MSVLPPEVAAEVSTWGWLCRLGHGDRSCDSGRGGAQSEERACWANGPPKQGCAGPWELLWRTDGFQSSVQLSASPPTAGCLQIFRPLRPPLTGNRCLRSHRRGGKQGFCNSSDSDVFHPFGLAPLPLPPLSSEPCGLLMEESQKQETDNLGSGCSCD